MERWQDLKINFAKCLTRITRARYLCIIQSPKQVSIMVILIVNFKSESDFERAQDLFDSDDCIYSVDYVNKEFCSLYFNCADQFDADSLEFELDTLLSENGFKGFYFESE